ncbi:MAG: ACT domain-containing protein [Vicinamibacterales bacterium]
MPLHRCSFSRLPGRYAIVRLAPGDGLPRSVLDALSFVSVTRTRDELSIVCDEAVAPAGARTERGWEVLKLHGPFALDDVGILVSCAAPLAEHGVSIFTISTFETDYILVRTEQADTAVAVLQAAGHSLAGE